MTIRIGTRKSKLALWQADWVASRLRDAGMAVEVQSMDTAGDKILDVSIHKIGSKGVFTEELERALAQGKFDIAVHSAKDLQSRLPDGFELCAFGKRESPGDVLVGNAPFDINKDQVTIGTSSTRRIATFARFYPHIRLVPMRGNLLTRIAKMEQGDCDALALARAGVERLGFEDRILMDLPIEEFTPAVGQGSIAVEVHASLAESKKTAIREAINDHETEQCILGERAYLAAMDGGCSIPIFGLARQMEGTFELTGGILGLDGAERISKTIQGSNPGELGHQLAQKILSAGGAKLLREIKAQL